MSEIPDDKPVDQITSLSEAIRYYLGRSKYRTAGELRGASDKRLLAIPAIGKISLQRIRRALEADQKPQSTSPPVECCKLCRFWGLTGIEGLEDYRGLGDCRRFPINGRKSKVEWCGEFRPGPQYDRQKIHEAMKADK